MSTALELRRAHWAPRNALARAAGQPEPMPRPMRRRDLERVIGIGAGFGGPWLERLVERYFRDEVERHLRDQLRRIEDFIISPHRSYSHSRSRDRGPT